MYEGGNLSFSDNYIIYDLNIPIITIYKKTMTVPKRCLPGGDVLKD